MVSVRKISESKDYLVYEYWLNGNDSYKCLLTYSKKRQSIYSAERFPDDKNRRYLIKATDCIKQYYDINNCYPEKADKNFDK